LSKKIASAGLSVVHASQQRYVTGLWHVQIGHSHIFWEGLVGVGGLLPRVEVDDLALGVCSNTKRLMGRFESGLVEVGLFDDEGAGPGGSDLAGGGGREEG
jgi:hypothetical protein